MVLRQVHQGPNPIVYPHWDTHTATPLHSDCMLHYTVGIEPNQVWWYSRSCGPEQPLSGTGSGKHPGILCNLGASRRPCPPARTGLSEPT